MTRENSIPDLEQLFAEAETSATTPGDQLDVSETFTQKVMTVVGQQSRQRNWGKVGIWLLLVPITPFLQDAGIALSQVLVLTLIDVESSLVSQLLAPINTVGGMLSMVVLGLKLLHKRWLG